MFKINITILK